MTQVQPDTPGVADTLMRTLNKWSQNPNLNPLNGGRRAAAAAAAAARATHTPPDGRGWGWDWGRGAALPASGG